MIGMRDLRPLLLPSAPLAPQPFALTAVAVYVAGAASHWLTVPDVLVRAGPWPFALAQAVLVWLWFVVHARRLRDAGRPIGLAVAVSVIYTLSVALLLILADAFFSGPVIAATDANTTSALGLVLLVAIVAALSGLPHDGLAWLMVAGMTAVALVPMLLAVGVSLWVATRPSVKRRMD